MFRFIVLLLVFILSYVPHAHAIKVDGQMGASILDNVLSFSKIDADEFCSKNPEFHNCDIIRQRQIKEEIQKQTEEVKILNSDVLLTNATTTNINVTKHKNENSLFHSINFE